MQFNTVTPSVNTGYSSLNPTYITDDENIAFQKYNAHEHIRARIANFCATDIQIGDPVYIYDSLGQSVFFDASTTPTPVLVDYITGSTLRVDTTSLESLVGAIMYYRYPRGNPQAKILLGIDITAGSQYITFTTPNQPLDYQQQEGKGLPGFISQAQLLKLASYSANFCITGIHQAGIFPLILNLECAAWLTSFYWTGDKTAVYPELRLVYTTEVPDVGTIWLPLCQGSDVYENIVIPYSEVIAGAYPTGRPTASLPVRSSVAIDFYGTGSNPNGLLTLSLNFLKVL